MTEKPTFKATASLYCVDNGISYHLPITEIKSLSKDEAIKIATEFMAAQAK